jgi:hypothetical protein
MRKNFKKELKRQTRTAIAAAVGFIIAYSWRETILEFFKKILGDFTSQSGFVGLYSSILVTVLGVLIIILSSRMLKEKR